MMYLSTALGPGPYLRTVLAHEYTHAVTFSAKAAAGLGADEEGWLDEAMAHLGEDLHGFSRQPRLPRQRLPVAARALSPGGRRLLRGRPVPEPR